MNDNDDFITKYSENILDDEVTDLEKIDLNPEVLVNQACLRGLAALTDADIKAGQLRFSNIMLFMESVCRAAGKLPKDYDDELNKLKDSDLFTKANKKMELILKYFFSTKPIYKPIEANDKPIKF